MLALFLSVICITMVQAVVISQHYAFHLPTLDNLLFDDEHFMVMKTTGNLNLCLVECGKHLDCVTFSFENNAGNCSLYSTGLYVAKMGTASSNWIFYAYGVPSCPVHNGFVFYRVLALCLHISVSAKSYTDATSYCAKRGGRVISLETSAKQETIGKVIAIRTYPMFWMGLNLHGSVWVWTSGQTLTDRKWDIYQPTCKPTGDTCLCAWIVRDWGWKWNDVQCERTTAVICEVI